MNTRKLIASALLIQFLSGCAMPADQEPTFTSPPSPASTRTPEPSPTPIKCLDYQQSVLLLVEDLYLEPLEEAFQVFSADLCREGYRVLIEPNRYKSPQEIRTRLIDLYFNKTELNLAGVIFVGNFPHPYQQVVFSYSNQPDTIQESISMQYFADLDGEFKRTKNYQPADGNAPLGEPIFDLHQGKTDWEIWVSVIPPYQGDPDLTTDALQRYFLKNHAYRTGKMDLPPTYLMIMAYDASTSDEYEQILDLTTARNVDWTSLDRTGDNQLIYLDNPVNEKSEDAGYQALGEGVADFTLIFDHGSVGSLGKIIPPWLDENQLQTAFLYTHSCSVGNLDNQYAIMTQILHHPNSLVLFAVGNTAPAGDFCTNQEGPPSAVISAGLLAGKSIGSSLLHHINLPLVEPWSDTPETCVATKILYGDPTLKLQGLN